MTFASMCPRCGHRASRRGAVIVGGVPVFGSRRRGLFSRVARRTATLLLMGAAAVGAFLLSHFARTPNAHQADYQEEQCRAIQDAGEGYKGQLADCLARLARLRAAERMRAAQPTRTLDSVPQSP